MAKREVVIGDKVIFTDEDGIGCYNAKKGDVGVVVDVDTMGRSSPLVTIKLTNRVGEITVCDYRVEILEEEITLDKAVEECKNIKTEIQRLQGELIKYESILFKAGVKLI